MVIWFMTEFLLRVWSAGCRSRYQEIAGRLQFIKRPLCIVGRYFNGQCCPITLALPSPVHRDSSKGMQEEKEEEEC